MHWMTRYSRHPCCRQCSIHQRLRNEFWQNCIHKLIVWFTRQRKPPFIIMGVGASVLPLNNGLSFLLRFNIAGTDISISNGGGNVLPNSIAPGIGIAMLIAGPIWSMAGAFNEYRMNSGKRVILVRGEGLRKVASPALDRHLHKRLAGQYD